MDSMPRVERMDDQRYLVSAVSDDDDVQIVVEITPEVRKWGHRRGYAEQSVVEAAINYLVARQRVDELPTKLFLEDVDAAHDDFRSTIVAWLDEKKDGVPAPQ
ncbi:MAG: hypothetical protein GX454_04845 [Brooklawnia sp.]|nr:hypothetical protein [Brooklawnia sp.]